MNNKELEYLKAAFLTQYRALCLNFGLMVVPDNDDTGNRCWATALINSDNSREMLEMSILEMNLDTPYTASKIK